MPPPAIAPWSTSPSARGRQATSSIPRGVAGSSSTLGGEAGGRGARAERREVEPRLGAEAVDHFLLFPRAGQERLPAAEMLEPVEVAGRDRRKLGLRHPAVGPVPVDQLEAVDEAAERLQLAPEASRRADRF